MGFCGMHFRRSSLFAGAALLSAGIAPAQASSYAVNPTQVVLTAQTTSRLITLQNLSTDSLRFQVTAFRWDQSAEGEMLLEPTRDVVAFPSLLTVAAGQQRTIRVGFTGVAGGVETSYRIFVEELPADPGEREPGDGIRVLTRMGIPIFIQPKQPAGHMELTQVQFQGGRVTFALRNTGNVHVLPQTIHLQGVGRTGAIMIDREEKGWYLLAGGVRAYQFEIPPQSCDGLTSLLARVVVAGTTLEERLATPLQCGR